MPGVQAMGKILAGGLIALVALSVVSTAPSTDSKPAAKKVWVSSAYKPPAALKLPDVEKLTRKLMRADRKTAANQLRSSRRVVAFFDNPKWRWMRAPRQEKCWDVPWQRTCTVARHAYRLHLTLALAAQRKLWRELPATNDWVTAVRVVQRAFPGTQSWLLSCSDAEGGHGEFVVYGGGSYYPGAEYAQTFHGDMVGGPLQYMWGTFKGHYRHGLDALRAKGFTVDLPPVSDVSAWRSPLAQAIAGAWAILNGQRSHWSASIGNGC